MNLGRRAALFVLNHASLLLFAAVACLFAVQSAAFLRWDNFVNILIQASSAAIVATGMTFVLLTGGIDLSVGSIMFLSAAIAGKILLGNGSVALAFAAIVGIGLICGALNALCVARLRILPFMATLAMLFVARGLSLWITKTRAMNLPDLVQIGAMRIGGIPFPVFVMAIVVLAAHITLRHTPFGRHIYAVGHDPEAARKAGIPTGRVLAWVYVISGACAAVGGLVLLSQLGAVSPTFGAQREFAAIAAAVLGGTSLFGGRGNVLPGTLLGAVLMQTVESGLNIINANPYVYPLITSSIIFLAVLLDCARHAQLQQMKRRKIRMESGAAA
ncbi:MAG: ABC transporter permease [Candidatus Sumerlaeia bacterium]|nr:ABC transporter permease [Candidatus Sumerlaeia bacterium]